MTSPIFFVSSSLIIVLLVVSKGFAADPSDLGISVEYSTRSFGGMQERGFVVTSVSPDSPAERAGLQARTSSSKMGDLDSPNETGDLIVAVSDRRVRDQGNLNTALSNLKPGDKIYLTVLRADGNLHKTLKIALKVGAVAAPVGGLTH